MNATFPPILKELISLLPEPGSVWTESDRLRWLAAAEGIFDVVYRREIALNEIPNTREGRSGTAREASSAGSGDDEMQSSSGTQSAAPYNSQAKASEDETATVTTDRTVADGLASRESGGSGTAAPISEPPPALPASTGAEGGEGGSSALSPLIDAATLEPLREAHARVFRVLRDKPDRPFHSATIARDAEIPVGSLPHVLTILQRKGYATNTGKLGAPNWIAKATGEPRIVETEPTNEAEPQGSSRKKPFRRFTDKPVLAPEKLKPLTPFHPAVTGKRTLFPTTVKSPNEVDRVLVSGGNSRKIGDRVVKGPWSGMPIFTLTLEERATCPESCFHWLTCYGNNLHWSRRHMHGDALIDCLRAELAVLQDAHPDGFVVRLHILGDFWSVDYVVAWAGFLRSFPALRVYGYTAWPRGSEIGGAIKRLTDKQWDRFAIRFSDATSKPQGATTIFRMPEGDNVDEGIVCPAETGKTDCCGTCGLCWSETAKDKTIVFVAHGRSAGRKAVPKPEARTMPFVSKRLIEEHAKRFAPIAHEPLPMPAVQERDEEPAAPPPGKSVPEDARAVMREYLKQKGFQPAVIGKGRFLFKGREVDVDGLVEMVNEMREEDGLPDIELGDAA